MRTVTSARIGFSMRARGLGGCDRRREWSDQFLHARAGTRWRGRKAGLVHKRFLHARAGTRAWMIESVWKNLVSPCARGDSRFAHMGPAHDGGFSMRARGLAYRERWTIYAGWFLHARAGTRGDASESASEGGVSPCARGDSLLASLNVIVEIGFSMRARGLDPLTYLYRRRYRFLHARAGTRAYMERLGFQTRVSPCARGDSVVAGNPPAQASGFSMRARGLVARAG